jgi:hypothetical protein
LQVTHRWVNVNWSLEGRGPTSTLAAFSGGKST